MTNRVVSVRWGERDESVTWAGLSMSETADLLDFHTQQCPEILLLMEPKQKPLSENGQRMREVRGRMDRLVGADRKTRVTQITTLYSCWAERLRPTSVHMDRNPRLQCT